MTIEQEIDNFEKNAALLLEFIQSLAIVDKADYDLQHYFLAEAVTFRLFRIYEKLVRVSFLNYCVINTTFNGNTVNAKLGCPDWDTAENILKSGNKFLDWGNVASVQKLADLVFEHGFPIKDLLMPNYSTLVDLQRFRNFVAHDSKEAADGFKKARANYVRKGDTNPETVGQLSLYRKKSLADITIMTLHQRVSELSGILKVL